MKQFAQNARRQLREQVAARLAHVLSTDSVEIREQQKEHVAATEQTKMVLYTDGRVKTLGRNRTIINN